MTWKVTPSLYNAWLFYAKPMFERSEEDENVARAEFIRCLRKEKSEETDAMRRGILFEDMIMQGVSGKGIKFPQDLDKKGKSLFNPEKHDVQCALHIADMVRDGVFQEKDGRELPSGNYIYGVADCILLNGIIDFKYSESYEMGKYIKSIQHWAYLYIWRMREFNYMIADGGKRPYIEPYIWSDNSLALLESRIAEMIHWINCDPEMREMFAEFWSYKKEI